jgi:hypothetical protein
MKLLLISFSFLFTVNSFSCTCITASVKERVRNYEIIVEGKVLAIEKVNKNGYKHVDSNGDTVTVHSIFGHTTTLLIKAYYKGKQIQDTMYIAPDESNCELHLKQGETYLIYGRYIDGKIQTSVCSGSGIFKDNPDLKYFRKKRSLKRKTNTLNSK